MQHPLAWVSQTDSVVLLCILLLHACRWLQPTLEIIGMQGGHTTNGTRGVVVSKAFAKVMCRLVPDQNASSVLEALHRHVASHAPPHTNFTLTAVASHGRVLTEPYFIPKDAPGNRAAAKVIPVSSWPHGRDLSTLQSPVSIFHLVVWRTECKTHPGTVWAY